MNTTARTNTRHVASIGLVLLLATSAAQATVCRVTTAGSAANVGYTWAAPTSLQGALANATCDEIWVAAGVYKPVVPASGSSVTAEERAVSFVINRRLKLYGGFAGSESSRDERDPALNRSVLSGDIDGDDNVNADGVDESVDTAHNTSNSIHVVFVDAATPATGISPTSVLDGFTITAGNSGAEGGGGLICMGVQFGPECSPTLSHLTFSGNRSDDCGGALYNDGSFHRVSNPILTDITFSGNSAGNFGGAMINDGLAGTSNPTLINVTFSGNSADQGGAMYNDGTSGISSPTLTNVTFSGNTAQTGGAVYNRSFNGISNPILTNVILWGDAAQTGIEIYNEDAEPTIDYSIVQGGDAGSVNNSGNPDTAFSTGSNNIDNDPVLGDLADNGGSTQTLLPDSGSAAFDSGDDEVCPAYDQRGIRRLQGPHCDIGAVEIVVAAHRCYVDANASGANDGGSWSDAYTDLQHALREVSCDEIWVASGVYKPVVPASNSAVTEEERAVSFVIDRPLRLYGGFAGTETSIGERDPTAAPSVLSGDIDGNDNVNADGVDETVDMAHNASNSTNVVIVGGATATVPINRNSLLDGFTISAGNGYGSGLLCLGLDGHACSPMLSNIALRGNNGGAMNIVADHDVNSDPVLTNVTFGYNIGGGIRYVGTGGSSSPKLTNVTFNHNSTNDFGGAIFSISEHVDSDFNLVLDNVTFNQNSTSTDGGAICVYASYGSTSLTLTNVTFIDNVANRDGGAMYVYSPSNNSVLTNVTFNGNYSGSTGGAMHNEGIDPKLTNVTFANNTAHLNGGAMYNIAGNAVLTNVTFNGNNADNGGAIYNDGIYGYTTTPILRNTILWNDHAHLGPEIYNNNPATDSNAEPVIDHSIVQGGDEGSANSDGSADTAFSSGAGNLDADPRLGDLADNGGSTATLLPAAGSAVIDRGDDGTCTAFDQRGLLRPQGPHCDIGAVEVEVIVPAQRCYVDIDAAGADDGSSWNDAYRDLRAALGNTECNEIWVTGGVYKPVVPASPDSVTDAERAVSFAIDHRLRLFGGFSGTESSINERAATGNRTVLSGDIDGDDFVDSDGIDETVDTAHNAGNSYHVVVIGGAGGNYTPDNLLIDAVTITAGHADGIGLASFGGGLLCSVHSGYLCNPALNNVTFSGNSAADLGGAMGNIGNGATSSPSLTNVTFHSNNADFGGAMGNLGAGGVSSPSLTNVTFSNNSANSGGGAMYNGVVSSGTSNPTLTNVIMWNDSASNVGNEIYNVSTANPSIDHSIIDGGCPDNSTCSNVVDADPLLGALTDNGGFTQTLLPGNGSPAIDAGEDVDCPATDQRGVTRPQGAHCDIGAVEILATETVLIMVTGEGTVSAATEPAPLSGSIAGCDASGGDCSATYARDDGPVALIATPAEGWHFDAWSGDCSGSNPTITVALDANKTCTAGFDIDHHSVGGTVSGLDGSGLVLQLNGTNDLPVSTNDTFAFATMLDYGASYAVTVATQPGNPNQTCAVFNGSGTVGNADIGNVLIACAMPSFSIGGTINGLAASGLSLQLNGQHDLAISASADTFAFDAQLNSGASYLVTVATQPTNQTCTLTGASGTVAGADVTSVTVNCRDAAPDLILAVDDGRDYVRYGQVVDYIVTLGNSGDATATDVELTSAMSAGFDLANATWRCIGAGDGATCASTGVGAFGDIVTLPAGHSLTWLVSVPVRADSSESEARFDVSADGAGVATDTDMLVIFRSGFDAPGADGAQAIGVAIDDDAAHSILYGNASATILVSAPRSGGIDSLRTLHAYRTTLQVQRVSLRGQSFVRLFVHKAPGREHISAWSPARTGAQLVIASVAGKHGKRIVLLAGALQPQSIVLNP